jgi:hypothetical protein
MQVESELLGGDATPSSSSPSLEASAEAAADAIEPSALAFAPKSSSAFSSRAQLISPPRLHAQKHRSVEEESGAAERRVIAAEQHEFDFESGSAQEQILQLQV